MSDTTVENLVSKADAPAPMRLARSGGAESVQEIVKEWEADADAKVLHDATYLPLHARITEASSVQDAATDAELAPLWDKAREIAPDYVNANEWYRARRNGIETDLRAGILGAKGAQEEARKADSTLAAGEAKVDARIESLLKLADNHTTGFQTTASADMIAEAGLIYTKYPMMSAVGFARETLDVLNRASDPAVSPGERFKANYFLKNAYEPLMERRATAPERFAKRLAPLAEMIHGTIKEHLDTHLGVRRAAAAANTKAAIRSEVATAKQLIPSMVNAKDGLLSVGAPNLFPKK